MKVINDLSTKAILLIGFTILIIFVIFLGVLSWKQSDKLWEQTELLYNQPLQIRRSIGALEANVLSASIEFRNFLIAKNGQKETESRSNIELNFSNIEKELNRLGQFYSGISDEIEKTRKSYVQWKTSLIQTIDFVSNGKINKKDVIEKIELNGDVIKKQNELQKWIHTIDIKAFTKAEEIYTDSNKKNKNLNIKLFFIVLAIIFLSVIVLWQLLTSIRKPLKKLTRAVNIFRQGEKGVICEIDSTNEFGQLAMAFNEMASTLETQNNINEKASKIAGIMLRESEARNFCIEVLKALIEHTSSQIGAIYLLNKENSRYEHFESIGLSQNHITSFPANKSDGELGLAITMGTIQHITDIHADSLFVFTSVCGDIKPREIITIPLMVAGKNIGVISLASLHCYSKQSIQLIDTITDTLAARTNGVLAYRKIKDLAEVLNEQNQELEAQKVELSAQTIELRELNAELEMQKRQLDDASRLKSTFLSNMSHELRTPLNSVIALSGVLDRRLKGKISDEEYSYFEVIERNGKHLLSLINDILDLSRIESGREEINITNFNPLLLISDIITNLYTQAQEKKIDLVNLVDNNLPEIQSDPDKCMHIMQNIIANAVKFTDSGSVQVLSKLAGDKLHLIVKDTGIGIAADQIQHIFDEFRQVDGSASRKYGGTGLGLAIAKKYAELLGGSIKVESSPGVGSTFTLIIPVKLDEYEKMEEVLTRNLPISVELKQNIEFQNKEKNILLVDDSEPALIQMTDFLTTHGYKVQHARNGFEALAQITSQTPDAIILDLMMPEMDGFEVLQRIRSVKSGQGLPVLILTAKHLTKQELSSLKGNNIHQLIQKGDINRVQLLSAVDMMLKAGHKIEICREHKRVINPYKGKLKVLIIEDNPDNMKTLTALLKETSTIISATDGLSGIDKARKNKPHVILMDLALPGMDGFETLTELRNDENLKNTPVIAVTASAMKGDREKILNFGFDAYISKPVEMSELFQILDYFHKTDN